MNKNETFSFIKENKFVAIARGLSEEDLLLSAQAIYDGGIRCLEVTFDQTDPENLVNTPKLIKALVDKFGDKMCIGSGTVMSVEQCEKAYNAGAKYYVSPNVDIDVLKKSKELNMISLVGAYSPTEIAFAYKNGADFVKIFPAGTGGPSYIKAVRAPLKHIPVLAVGGVNEDNITEYMSTGVLGVGVGDKLLKSELINEKKFDELTLLAKKFVENMNK